MNEMHYLDYCIQEALRKYPPLSFLTRVCGNDYTVADTGITIPKGMTVNIPIYGIHHDTDIFPNPEVYDPLRFTPEEVNKRHPYSFMPFGEGPRNCIGLRFGLMQTRVGLVTMLRNFQISPCSKSTNPLILKPEPLILTPEGGLWLNIKKLEN